MDEGGELHGQPSGATTVTLKKAASILGVHYMTAYRYVRQGRLAAWRDGTEWRISLSAIESFVAGAPSADLHPASALDSAAAWRDRMESCLLASDETSAWRVIETALSAGHDPAFCYLDMIAAALSSIGDRWAAGEIDVADQHLATAVAVRLVSRLGARFRRPGRSRGTVVFGAPRGEMHILPIAIVADLVRLQRYDVLELGADVPAEAFVVSAARTPRLLCVGIGITQLELLDTVQEVVDAVRAVNADVPIIVGGLATKGLGRTALRGVTAVVDGGRDAIAVIESFASTRAIRRIG
jgi:excisionase family DNA binding protein